MKKLLLTFSIFSSVVFALPTQNITAPIFINNPNYQNQLSFSGVIANNKDNKSSYGVSLEVNLFDKLGLIVSTPTFVSGFPQNKQSDELAPMQFGIKRNLFTYNNGRSGVICTLDLFYNQQIQVKAGGNSLSPNLICGFIYDKFYSVNDVSYTKKLDNYATSYYSVNLSQGYNVNKNITLLLEEEVDNNLILGDKHNVEWYVAPQVVYNFTDTSQLIVGEQMIDQTKYQPKRRLYNTVVQFNYNF